MVPRSHRRIIGVSTATVNSATATATTIATTASTKRRILLVELLHNLIHHSTVFAAEVPILGKGNAVNFLVKLVCFRSVGIIAVATGT